MPKVAPSPHLPAPDYNEGNRFQDGVTVSEDLERPAWGYDDLDFYLAAGCGFRVASLRSALVSMSARSGLRSSTVQLSDT